MGLVQQSTEIGTLKNFFNLNYKSNNQPIIALAGNPNVGKSTVFNSLTGLNQHTGNWPGKTVTKTCGKYKHKDKEFILVDLPGTYSLMSNSLEEEIARDFICFGNPDVTIIVTDSTCLERNLNLVLQVLEITDNVVVCVNLIDEARRKNIEINFEKLSKILGVPVVGTNARGKEGLGELKDCVCDLVSKKIKTKPLKITYNENIEKAIEMIKPTVDELVNDKVNSRWLSLKLLDSDSIILKSINKYFDFNLLEHEELNSKISKVKKYLAENKINQKELHDEIVTQIVNTAENISKQTITYNNINYNDFDRKLDKILTSKIYGFPIMIGLLSFIFWITIKGANYPSQVLSSVLFWIEKKLSEFFVWVGLPPWMDGLFVKGAYRTLAWVVSVMLPPMAIFFPLFTFLEDLGYLPRIAFNLDNFFKKACAHGKQALTMCMGFGCNAVGVIGCRIIDSPRERLIATLTNSFVPCNGRFPTLIAIAAIFIEGTVKAFQSIITTLTVVIIVLIGIIMTLIISRILSKTVLKGVPSSFTLELPPYRKPQIGRIIIYSVFDRTLFVLGRAIMVAAPAGLIIWLMANVSIAKQSLLDYGANFLHPFAQLIGMDGYILMAFILGFPANEIVLPIIVMCYMATGSMTELGSIETLRDLLIANGWTWLTAICVMLFSLMHFPCGTTVLTIKKETQSIKWTALAFIIPILTGITVCFVITCIVRLVGYL